jgi:hypothetical protein
LGGNNVADVQRLTIVADPANTNGSAFGRIGMGNTVFGGSNGVVGVSAVNVQVQTGVVIGDINTSDTAIPTLIFGANSQFGTVVTAGGDLLRSSSLGGWHFGRRFFAGPRHVRSAPVHAGSGVRRTGHRKQSAARLQLHGDSRADRAE